MEFIKIDRRFKDVVRVHEEARGQMVQYFAARYSWGQPCDPMRAKDWAMLAGYLMTCYKTGKPLELDERFIWPSGNRGTIRSLVNQYHDGAELLDDLGICPEEWRAEEYA